MFKDQNYFFLNSRIKASAHTFKVVVGDYRTDAEDPHEKAFTALHVYKHSGYVHGQHDNDIALVMLAQPVTMDRATVWQACLPTYGTQPFGPNDVCYVTGWGDSMGKLNAPVVWTKQHDSNCYKLMQDCSMYVLSF